MTAKSFYHYYQCNRVKDKGDIVRVMSFFRPSWSTVPKSGTWIVQEYEQGRWCSVGEITWGTLKQLDYIGKMKVKL